MSKWTPSNQSATLSGWYKADAITGLSDGDAVASWVDSSGQGNTLTQSTASAKPSYQTNELNSLPVVRFDKDHKGGDNMLNADLGGDFEPGTGDFYIAMVASFSSVGTQFFMSKADNGTEGLNVFLSTNATTDLTFRPQTSGGTTNNVQQSNVVNSSFHTIVGRRVSSTLGSEYDGSAFTTDNGSKVNDGDMDNNANFNIGSSSTGGLDTDMDLAEAFIAVGTLNDKDLQRTSGYLSHKYGLASNLPDTHSYKSFAPAFGIVGNHNNDTQGEISLDISGDIASDGPAGVI